MDCQVNSSQKLKYLTCKNQEDHEEEQQSLICVDPTCQKDQQLQPLCNMCLEPPYFHEKEVHKTRNFKKVLKGLEDQLDDLQKDDQANTDAGIAQSDSMVSQAEKVSKEFKILANYFYDISKNILNNSSAADIVRQGKDAIFMVLNSSDNEQLKSSLKELRELVEIDAKKGIYFKEQKNNLQKYLEIMKQYADTLLPYVKIASEDSNNLFLEKNNIKIEHEQQENIEMQIQNLEQELIDKEQDIQRLIQQQKNTQQTLEQWKQKCKESQQNNGLKEFNQFVKLDQLNQENSELKDAVNKLKLANSNLREQNQCLNLKNKQYIKKIEDINQAISGQKRQQQQQQQQRSSLKTKTCKRGHGLKKVDPGDPLIFGLSCDECDRRIMPLRCCSYRCGDCDYDICERCNDNERVECPQQ